MESTDTKDFLKNLAELSKHPVSLSFGSNIKAKAMLNREKDAPFNSLSFDIDSVPTMNDHLPVPGNSAVASLLPDGFSVYVAQKTALAERAFVRARLVWYNPRKPSERNWFVVIDHGKDSWFNDATTVCVIGPGADQVNKQDADRTISAGDKISVNLDMVKMQASVTIGKFAKHNIDFASDELDASQLIYAGIYPCVAVGECKALPTDKLMTFSNLAAVDSDGKPIPHIWRVDTANDQNNEQDCGMCIGPPSAGTLDNNKKHIHIDKDTILLSWGGNGCSA